MTQPVKLPVSYWYQSTDSVTGMTGTCLQHDLLQLVHDRVLLRPGWWCSAYALISASVCGLLYRSKLDPAGWPIGAELPEYSHCRSS